MPARKRQASDPLLPHRSPKHPRTQPPSAPSILDRWIDLGRSTWLLGRDTISLFFRQPQQQELPTTLPSSSSLNQQSQQPSQPSQSTRHTALPSRPPIPTQFQPRMSANSPNHHASALSSSAPTRPPPTLPNTSMGASTSTSQRPRPHVRWSNGSDIAGAGETTRETSTSTLRFSASAAGASNLGEQLAALALQSNSRLPQSRSQAKAPAPSASRSTLSNSHSGASRQPAVDRPQAPSSSKPAFLSQSQSSAYASSSRSSVPFATPGASTSTSEMQRERFYAGNSDKPKLPPRKREHIYAKDHKKHVREERKKDREEMMKELYHLKRTSGYGSDFSTFQKYLNYRARLEMLDRREVLSPSASLTDLRIKESEAQRARRHSFSFAEDISPSPIYLTRALQKARLTLASPPPPKPFSPTIDQLHIAALRRNAEIDARLRPTTKPLPAHLPSSEEAFVDRVLKGGVSADGAGGKGPGLVIARLGREQVTLGDIVRLRPGEWLNDEVINFYGALVVKRSEDALEALAKGGEKASQGKENGMKPAVNGLNGLTPKVNGVNGTSPSPKVNGVVNGKVLHGSAAVNGLVNGVTSPNSNAAARKKPLSIHYFNTFFWSKLRGEGYEKGRLAKWTKKLDLFTKDILLVPINHNNSHWTGAAINFHKKRIESYDSMGLDRVVVFKLLREYIDLEHRNKKKTPFDFTGWEDYELDETPQQENGYDCGVFTCQFLETLSRGEERFNFSQKDMPFLRRRMIWEIGKGKLWEEDG